MIDILKYKHLRLSVLIVFVLFITFLGWLCDDAYHAFAMAKHLVNGDGFVYMAGERVNASTCPLFTLIVAAFYFVTGNMYLSGLFLNILFSAIAFYILIFKICKTPKQVILSALICMCSYCFISYTTSGLENSLLFMLAAMFVLFMLKRELYSKKDLLIVALLISLIALTRMDAVLLFAPLAVYIYLCKRKNSNFFVGCLIAFVGLLPFIAWEAFSVIYYGFPMPNTAYMKLGTNYPLIEYVEKGVAYFIISGINDIFLIFIPIIFSWFIFLYYHKNFGRSKEFLFVFVGVILYYIYLLRIGGDFMLGRHLTVPFFVSVLGAVSIYNTKNIIIPDAKKKFLRLAFCLCVIYSISFPPALFSQFLWKGQLVYTIKTLDDNGIVISDERHYFMPITNFTVRLIKRQLYDAPRFMHTPDQENIEKNLLPNGITRHLMSSDRLAAGEIVFYYNNIYLTDYYALGDAFLAHLPARKINRWRVGHAQRNVPEGYYETVETNTNCIKNENLRKYYDIITLITRGDIWSKERWKAIVDINLGRYKYLTKNAENHE